jgi:hypothetical protein
MDMEDGYVNARMRSRWAVNMIICKIPKSLGMACANVTIECKHATMAGAEFTMQVDVSCRLVLYKFRGTVLVGRYGDVFRTGLGRVYNK